MFKYKYLVSYSIQVNKKAPISYYARPLILNERIEDVQAQGKLIKVLLVLHSVNKDAITLGRHELIERTFAPIEWVERKAGKFMKGVLALFGPAR